LSGMKRLPLPKFLVVAVVACVGMGAQPQAWAQGESKGENFSAKPAPQLFASDCTGGGCHKGPQGLAKGQSQGSLAGFLREHYTNSRESAAAIASYLSKLPSAPEPAEARGPRAHPSARSSRASARPEEEAPAAGPGARPRRGVESSEAAPKQSPASRAQRGRQKTAVVPPVPPEPPPAPPPKQYDIFD
jgi:hypothetical protein